MKKWNLIEKTICDENGESCIEVLSGTAADLRLAAAAPEMLEALSLLVEAISSCPEYIDAMKSIGFDIDVVDSIKTSKQVIKKARGEK